MLVSNPLLEPLRAVFRAVSRAEYMIGGLKADPEAPFRTMIEDLPDSYVVLDPDGTILYANAAWRALRSLNIEEALGQNINDLAITSQRQELARQRRDLLRGLSPEQPTAALEFAVRDDAHVQVLYKGWFDANGDLLAVTGLARDRTEAHRHQEQLQGAIDALAESNRDLQDFAHIASHDLQEPLRKISAFTERLADKYGDQLDDRGVDYLSRINSASGRMQQLIQSLLDFARVNSRAGEMESTELGDVVQLVLHDLEVAIEESAAEITVGDLPRVQCDPVQMRQLFQNLLGNALKFRVDDVPPKIEIRCIEPDAKHWQLAFVDNGIGFDQDYADKVFGPFQRLNTRAAYAGSGIGLSVCRRIVERHGGRITATSAPGEGATFTVTLPRQV